MKGKFQPLLSLANTGIKSLRKSVKETPDVFASIKGLLFVDEKPTVKA